MEFSPYSDFYTTLDLPRNASLKELDERYFELTEYYSMRKHHQGAEEVNVHLKVIDEAYNALLAKFIRENDGVEEPVKEIFTMKQIINGQDKIHMQNVTDEDTWMPPTAGRSPLDEFDGEQDRGIAPGFKIRGVLGDLMDAPDRAVLVRR